MPREAPMIAFSTERLSAMISDSPMNHVQNWLTPKIWSTYPWKRMLASPIQPSLSFASWSSPAVPSTEKTMIGSVT